MWKVDGFASAEITYTMSFWLLLAVPCWTFLKSAAAAYQSVVISECLRINRKKSTTSSGLMLKEVAGVIEGSSD